MPAIETITLNIYYHNWTLTTWDRLAIAFNGPSSLQGVQIRTNSRRRFVCPVARQISVLVSDIEIRIAGRHWHALAWFKANRSPNSGLIKWPANPRNGIGQVRGWKRRCVSVYPQNTVEIRSNRAVHHRTIIEPYYRFAIVECDVGWMPVCPRKVLAAWCY